MIQKNFNHQMRGLGGQIFPFRGWVNRNRKTLQLIVIVTLYK